MTAQRATGWFGFIDMWNRIRQTKVHYVDARLRPICGTVLAKGMRFQWCSIGFNDRYIECERCKTARKRIDKGES